MKKVLVILALVAMTGIASAELLNNPETFEGAALGIVGTGVPIDGWESWGAGEGDGGWYSTWNGGQQTASVVDAGGTQALYIEASATPNWYSYNLAFSHGNEIASLPVGSNAPGYMTLEFDVLAGAEYQPIVKIEHWEDLAHTIQVDLDAWDSDGYQAGEGTAATPGWLAAGHHVFTVEIGAGANYVTPVIGITGGGTFVVVDNVELSANPVPEPATMALLGLGALVLRRRK